MRKTESGKLKAEILILGFLALLLMPAPASAQSIFISPRLDDPDFGAYHIIAAEQLANHSTVIEVTQDPLPSTDASWQFIAGYACYFEDQFVIASWQNRDYPWTPQHAWFRSINNPCAAAAAPFAWPMAGMEPDYLEPLPKLSDGLKAYRGTNSHGITMRIGPEILPTCTNGVRRFLGVPE